MTDNGKKLPNSFFEDFEALQKDLKTVPKKAKASDISPIINETWESLLKAGSGTSQCSYEEFASPEVVKSFEFVRDDPTYVRDVILLSAKNKLFNYFRRENFSIDTFSNDQLLSLSVEERKSLILWLGLSVKKQYTDAQIVDEGMRFILLRLGICENQNYKFFEMYDFAKKADSLFFTPMNKGIRKSEIKTVTAFLRDNIPNIFDIVTNENSGTSVFYFVLKTPDQRATWMVEKFSLIEKFKQNLMSFLGLKYSEKYSISQMVSIAEIFDNRDGRGESAESDESPANNNVIFLNDKIYLVNDVIKYVIMPHTGRARWLELQSRVK